MRKRVNFLDAMTSAADLQTEPLPGMPLIELAGDCRVLIENHKGVIQYGKNRIGVRVRFGYVAIEGECLQLCKMSRHQLIIKGNIDAIRIFRG